MRKLVGSTLARAQFDVTAVWLYHAKDQACRKSNSSMELHVNRVIDECETQ